MVYDFGSLSLNNSMNMGESTRSISSSEAEFELEDRPALIRGRKRCDGLSTSLRGRPRSTSASRKITTVMSKFTDKTKKDIDDSKETGKEFGVELEDDEGSNHSDSKSLGSKRRDKFDVEGNRPKLLRAPSLTDVEDVIGKISNERAQSPHRYAVEKNKTAPDVFRRNTGSPPKSPPRSPRRLWPNRNVANSANMPVVENLVYSIEAPSSPSETAHAVKHLSPLKALSQRAIGNFRRHRNQSTDNKIEQAPAVSESNNIEMINNSISQPSSPTKRAISSILRVCSYHDRSVPSKGVRDDNAPLHKSQSTHGRIPFTMKSNKNESVEKNSSSDKVCAQLNIEELGRSSNDIPCTSERGTRSTGFLIENDDNEQEYSRTVTSLCVAPRSTKSRKSRISVSRDIGKEGTNRVARPRRRSEAGITNSSARNRARSVGRSSKMSTSSHESSRKRSSSGTKPTSRLQATSQDSESKVIRSTSRSRDGDGLRESSRHHMNDERNKYNDNSSRDRSKSRTRSTSQNQLTPRSNKSEEDCLKVARRSSSRRNISTSDANSDDPKTPRSTKSVDQDSRRSARRSSSRRNVSDSVVQSIRDEKVKTPRSSKSEEKTDRTKSVSRSSSRRNVPINDLHIPLIDEPQMKDARKNVADSDLRNTRDDNAKTPRSRKSEEITDRIKSVSRSSSRHNVPTNDLHISLIDEPQMKDSRHVTNDDDSDKIVGKLACNESRTMRSDVHGNSDVNKTSKHTNQRRSSISSRVSQHDPKSPRSRKMLHHGDSRISPQKIPLTDEGKCTDDPKTPNASAIHDNDVSIEGTSKVESELSRSLTSKSMERRQSRSRSAANATDSKSRAEG